MDLTTANLASNFQELNVAYNDEFEIMTDKFTDTSNIRKK